MKLATHLRLCALVLLWLLLPIFAAGNFLRNAWVLNRQALRWTRTYTRNRSADLRAAWVFLRKAP
jgi:hypothetical protein